MAERAAAMLASPALWAGALVLVFVLHVTREPARRLIDGLFIASGLILERFAASTRQVGGALFEEARAALAQMERQEFAHEVAARQKELISVLERFSQLEERYRSAAKALERTADATRRGRAFKRLVALAARMTAGQERFNTNVEFVTANRARLVAVHAGEVYTYSPFIRLAFAAIFIPFIALGGVLNFMLIEQPLATLFAGAAIEDAAGLSMGEMCALAVIVVEAVIGFFLLEALRVTKVLPNFHSLAPLARRAWAAVFGLALFLMSVMEAALVVWRFRLNAQDGPGPELGAAPLVVQIVLGMLTPLVLALVAIPLEAFLKNARVVALFLLGAVSMLLALPLFVAGAVLRWAGAVAWAAYEVMAYPAAAVVRVARAVVRSLRAGRDGA